jgi:glycerol-3-phosphate dehydrogenase
MVGRGPCRGASIRPALKEAAEAPLDILVIGGGIHGACVAWDAARRGLRVALVERGDYGCATSHNSLKIVHGGLRYLQHLDFVRVRQCIRERRFWLRAAPHLVRPLEFVIPAYGYGMRGRLALATGMLAYRALSVDRNSGIACSDRQIPNPRLLSKQECCERIPGVERRGLTGAACWHDAQMLDTDRLLVSVLLAARSAGAKVVNYAVALGFLGGEERVAGALVRDEIGGSICELRAALTINAAGPWVASLLEAGPRRLTVGPNAGLSKGLNLVVDRRFGDHAFGITSRRPSDAAVPRGSRLFFVTPWRERTIIGTSHEPFSGSPEDHGPTEAEIAGFLAEVNSVWPEADIRRDEVLYTYSGLTPAAEEGERSRANVVRDHLSADGVNGLLSVLGVKYTTARLVAEKAVDLAHQRLQRSWIPSTTATAVLPGADGHADGPAMLSRALDRYGSLYSRDALEELIGRYGSGYVQVLEGCEAAAEDAGGDLLRCCVRYAVRHEDALFLEDFVLRRTSEAQLGRLRDEHLGWCADTMAVELGWTPQRKQLELDSVRARLAAHGRIRSLRSPLEPLPA